MIGNVSLGLTGVIDQSTGWRPSLMSSLEHHWSGRKLAEAKGGDTGERAGDTRKNAPAGSDFMHCENLERSPRRM